MPAQVIEMKKAAKGEIPLPRHFALPDGGGSGGGDGDKKSPWLQLHDQVHNSLIDAQIREVRHSVDVMERRITELEQEKR